MNYYNKLLNYLFPIWILVSINFSQDLSIDLILLNTGEFTLNSWNNVAELWYVEVINNSSQPVEYKLKFQLYEEINQNLDLLVEGRTKVLSIENNESPVKYSNLDNVLNQNYLEEYNEELKKESPFYVGDGSTGSEMKNTCKRCNKIWYLDAEELKDLENRLETSTKLMGQMEGLSMVTALFNPMLAAQSTTTMAANTGALKSLADELNEKSRCPECQSRSIERTLVGEDEKTLHKKVKIKRKKSGPSKMQELEKLSEMKKEGLIDITEFKQMKKEILGK